MNVLIAGYLGQKKQDEANTTVTHGLLLAFGIGALLNLLSLLIMKPYFRAFTNNEEIYQLSLAYMSVCSFMQIPNMVHIAIQKMIQATGNMVAPMWFQIAGVVVNFVFDPLLIFGIGVFPAMGIRGAAVATVAGYLLSMILAFALLLGKKQKVQDKDQRLSFAKEDDPPYFRPWPAIFYYERPQFVYGDVRQSVSGGVFRYGDCILRCIF
ncbi:MAG: MATE family efflux transporter [Anaerovoracaceae bacterium]